MQLQQKSGGPIQTVWQEIVYQQQDDEKGDEQWAHNIILFRKAAISRQCHLMSVFCSEAFVLCRRFVICFGGSRPFRVEVVGVDKAQGGILALHLHWSAPLWHSPRVSQEGRQELFLRGKNIEEEGTQRITWQGELFIRPLLLQNDKTITCKLCGHSVVFATTSVVSPGQDYSTVVVPLLRIVPRWFIVPPVPSSVYYSGHTRLE